MHGMRGGRDRNLEQREIFRVREIRVLREAFIFRGGVNPNLLGCGRTEELGKGWSFSDR